MTESQNEIPAEVAAHATICALSTAKGRAALALIRISGPQTRQILTEICGDLPVPRRPSLRILKNASGEILDEALITFFAAPQSFTGEDLAEISAHGNPVIVEGILEAIVSRGTRLAEAGEFTKRALANGRLSLSQIEALDWVLNASQLEGARLGLRMKVSGLSKPVEEVLLELRNLLFLCQAHLDFSDEEVGKVDPEDLAKALERVTESLRQWVKSFQIHKHLFDKWTVVLIGPPNSGKSSLFNWLIGEEKAIVFDQPGTTRDILEADLEKRGNLIRIIDTAGLRETDDQIESLGIARTHKILKAADVICWMSEAGQSPSPELRNQYPDKKWIFTASKADLHRPNLQSEFLPISVVTEQGLEEFLKLIEPPSQDLRADFFLSSKRQAQLVEAAVTELENATREVREGAYLDWVSQRVLEAQRLLKDLVDQTPPEETLKEIFARFCIGK